jgi:hypothetical protein
MTTNQLQFEYNEVDNIYRIIGYTIINDNPWELSLPYRIGNSMISEIGENAFQNAKTIKSIRIPEEITKIGQSAFLGCDNLSQINYYGSHLGDLTDVFDKYICAKFVYNEKYKQEFEELTKVYPNMVGNSVKVSEWQNSNISSCA